MGDLKLTFEDYVKSLGDAANFQTDEEKRQNYNEMMGITTQVAVAPPAYTNSNNNAPTNIYPSTNNLAPPVYTKPGSNYPEFNTNLNQQSFKNNNNNAQLKASAPPPLKAAPSTTSSRTKGSIIATSATTNEALDAIDIREMGNRILLPIYGVIYTDEISQQLSQILDYLAREGLVIKAAKANNESTLYSGPGATINVIPNTSPYVSSSITNNNNNSAVTQPSAPPPYSSPLSTQQIQKQSHVPNVIANPFAENDDDEDDDETLQMQRELEEKKKTVQNLKGLTENTLGKLTALGSNGDNVQKQNMDAPSLLVRANFELQQQRQINAKLMRNMELMKKQVEESTKTLEQTLKGKEQEIEALTLNVSDNTLIVAQLEKRIETLNQDLLKANQEKMSAKMELDQEKMRAKMQQQLFGQPPLVNTTQPMQSSVVTRMYKPASASDLLDLSEFDFSTAPVMQPDSNLGNDTTNNVINNDSNNNNNSNDDDKKKKKVATTLN